VSTIVVGVFDSATNAYVVVEDLVNAGFQRSDISVVTRDEQTSDTGTSATAVGVGTGAVLGGVGGLLVGLGALAIPGIGPALAAGPLAAALAGAGLGAAAGGVIGVLVDLGVPEEDAQSYAEAVRRGGTLVVVKAEPSMVGRAEEIIERHGPVDIEERITSWRTAGWAGWDAQAAPYTSEDVIRHRDEWWSRQAMSGTTPGMAAAVGGQGTQPVTAPIAGPPAGPATSAPLSSQTGQPSPGAEPVTRPGVQAGVRDRSDRGVRAYVPTQPSFGATEPVRAPGGGWNESDYRPHYESTFAGRGVDYDLCRQAYRFGFELEDQRNPRAMDWPSLEADARRQWEATRPGTWERIRDAVHYAWERARDRRAA
jgi:uncharacterized membrane protein